MGISKQLAEFFDGAADTVLARFIENKDDRRQARKELLEKALDNEAVFVMSARDVIVAEANSQSWLTRSWRPLLMLTFGGLLVAHWFGFTADNVTEAVQMELLDIIKIGIGGYIVGRSAEQVAKEIGPALGKK